VDGDASELTMYSMTAVPWVFIAALVGKGSSSKEKVAPGRALKGTKDSGVKDLLEGKPKKKPSSEPPSSKAQATSKEEEPAC